MVCSVTICACNGKQQSLTPLRCSALRCRPGQDIELKRIITEREYFTLKRSLADATRFIVRQRRTCFLHEVQLAKDLTKYDCARDDGIAFDAGHILSIG